jgi:uncharacterized protein (DUF58 family)
VSAGAPEEAADPAVEQTLRRLELAVTRRLDGMLLGDHLGLLPGQGTEKAESREYHVGDDVRRMDWAVTARTNTPHVHDLIADRELETWAVVDLSASLELGTGRTDKRFLAVAAVAAVGFLTARAGNRVGAVVLTGAGCRVIPARPGRAGLRALLRSLLATPRSAVDVAAPDLAPGALADLVRGRRPAAAAKPAAGGLAEAIDLLRRPPRRRGLVVVVSDFLPAGDAGWERPLRALAVRHQVLGIEVVDPLELELPDVGLLPLIDAETGQLVEVPTGSRRVRERYAAAAAAHRGQVSLALRRAGAGHLLLRTDSDWLLDIVRYVRATRRRGPGRRRPPGAGLGPAYAPRTADAP